MINKLIYELGKFKAYWELSRLVPKWASAIVTLEEYVKSPHNLIMMVDRVIINKEGAGFMEPIVKECNTGTGPNPIWALVPVPILQESEAKDL